MIAATTDGHEVKVTAHVKFPEQLSNISDCGAGEIGLLELEAFAGGCSIQEQEEKLVNVLIEAGKVTGGRTVTVLPAELDRGCHCGKQPFLGRRGIRSYLAEPEHYRSQFRALIRAGAYGSFALAVPMVGHVQELTQLKKVIYNFNAELEGTGLPGCSPTVGIMVEVPSVLPTINTLIYESRFFTVGEHFLKYLMADECLPKRDDDFVPFYHQAFLLQTMAIVGSLRRRKADVRICAPIVKDSAAIPILVGLGFDEIVAPPEKVPEISKIIRSINYRNALLVTSKTTSFWDPGEAREYAMERLLKFTH